jgi:hypothetical protein
MVLTKRSANVAAATDAVVGAKAAAGHTTTPFNQHAGLVYKVLSSKRPVTSTAEAGGKKVGQMKKGSTFVAIEGTTNTAGDLRIRSTRGWVTAKLADGTKLLEVETSAAASAKENAVDLEDALPVKRRQRTMTMALSERNTALQEVFVTGPEGTPTKAAAKCATKGQIVPAVDDLLFLIATLRKDEPNMGVKKLVKEIQEREPMWNCGCKEVRTALRA